MKQNASVFTMYAVTPCHAGSGSSLGVVDNPIQRERHTNWPVIQSSGMKGAMRAHFDRHAQAVSVPEEKEQYANLTNLVFGDENSGFAGAIAVSDAKILAFPMRASVAPFVWVTCPAVLQRLARDLRVAGVSTVDLADLPKPTSSEAYWFKGGADLSEPTLVLEDIEVTPVGEWQSDAFAGCLDKAERLLLVSDEVFAYGVSNCTSILAQIKIDQESGTTQQGSLRYQEELPADTILYTTVFWGGSRDDATDCGAETIRGFVKDKVFKDFMQVGGDETLGRGIFELGWL